MGYCTLFGVLEECATRQCGFVGLRPSNVHISGSKTFLRTHILETIHSPCNLKLIAVKMNHCIKVLISFEVSKGVQGEEGGGMERRGERGGRR